MLYVNQFFAFIGPQVSFILALIAADVLLGVAYAVMRKRFDLSKLTDFFATMVLPKLIGWVAVAVIGHFAIPQALPAGYEWIGDGVIVQGTYIGIVVTLFASVIGHLRALGMDSLPVIGPFLAAALDRLGVKSSADDGLPF